MVVGDFEVFLWVFLIKTIIPLVLVGYEKYRQLGPMWLVGYPPSHIISMHAHAHPPFNFHMRALDKTHHVVQNQMTGISQYTLSDLIALNRVFRTVQNKLKNLPFYV